MVNRIEGEGPDKIPPSREQIGGISEEVEISQAPKTEKAFAGEGVREAQEGMGIISTEVESKVGPFDTETIFKKIESSEEELQQLIKAGEVDPKKAPSLGKLVEENSGSFYESAKIQAKTFKNWGEFSGGVILIPNTVMEGAEDYFAKPVEKYLIPLNAVNDVVEKVAEGVTDVGLIFKVPATLGKGASLIYKRTILKMVEQQMLNEEKNLAEFPDEKKLEELKELKAWVKVQNDFLFNEAKAFGIETASFVPKGIEISAKIAGGLGEKFDVATFGAFTVVSIAAKGYAVHVARKKRKTHVEWVERFREKPIVEQPITSTINVQLEGGKRKVYEVPVAPKEMVEAVNGLLEKRKRGLQTRMKLNQSEFDSWAIPCANSDKPYDVIKEGFKNKGVDLEQLSEPIENKEDLKEALISPEKQGIKEEMLQRYAEKKETISVLVRNGLKSLVEKKHKIERKFLNFNLIKETIALTLSVISFVVILTLQILLIAGVITLPAAAFAYPGLGLFVVGIALIMIGLVVLSYYKPNFFNELLRGVQIRLALNNIPNTFHNFRLNLAKMKRLKKDLELSTLGVRVEKLKWLLENREIKEARNLPAEVKPLLKKFRNDIDGMLKSQDYDKLIEELELLHQEEKARIAKEQKKLDAKIKEIEVTVNKWEGRVKKLRMRLVNAGWKDFERASNLAKTAPKIIEGKETKKEDLGLANVLVEGLLNDDNYLDQATKKVLHEQLGINLDKLKESSESQKEKIKVELEEALKTFFAMDDSALIKFIKLQQAKFEFGVLGGEAG